MTIVPPPLSDMIICDDLPEAYIRFLYGARIASDTVIFSRVDALHEAAAERLRYRQTKQHQDDGRPARGRAVP